MNKLLRNTLLVVAILVLAGGVFLAGTFFGRATTFGFAGMMGGYRSNGASNNGYGPGMMGGSTTGYGMMGGQNPGGMMGGSTTGYGMMGGQSGAGMMGANYPGSTSTTPLTLDQAKSSAESYLAALKNSDLQISEIMIFDNNAYVAVTEKSTGLGAFELLVDPVSKVAYPEHGPNMMWNLKYGGLNHQNMMSGQGGMMGGSGMMGNNGMMGGNGWSGSVPSNVPADMTVSPEKAIQAAQAYLDANQAGATAATDPMQFYGYYTLDFEKNGAVVGMLSVNGYSGQVFLHTWHGKFIQEKAY